MTDAPSTPVVATTSSVQPREYLSFFAAMRAVVWSFVGLRSSNGSRLDVSQIKPLHFVVAGFLSLFVMIFSLVFLVTQVIL